MSVTFGFYNSQNHDRKYNALQMSQIFDGVITDGVYHSIGKAFSVTAGSGMNLNVAPGRAWFDHTWTYNDTILVLPVTESHQVYDRISAVIIRVDAGNRKNTICMKDGTPSSSPQKPTMTSTDTVTEHPLAYVTIPAGSTSIESRNISFVVGTSECPFVAGVVQSVSIDALVQNWKDEFAHLIDNSSNEFDILMRNFENLVNESGDDFDDLMQNCEKKYDQAISNSNAQFGDVLDRFDTLYEKLITQTEQAASKTIIDGSVTYEKLAHDAVRMIFRNVEVKTADFYIDPSNTSIRYPYRASIPLIGVDSTMYPDVGFGDAVIGFAPFAESYGEVDAYNGGIYIYSKSIPSENITIPIVFCWR